MSDLNNLQAAQTVKIVGTDASGIEIRPINIDANGTLYGAITSPGGQYAATVTGYGSLRTSPEATSIFYDPFDSAIDTVYRWNPAVTSGGATFTQASGGVILTTGTTASAYASLSSKPLFVGLVPGYAQVGYALKYEANPTTTNTYRFWGLGTVQATPTTSNAMVDAFGWEIDTAGKLYAVVYNNGTRAVIADLSATTGNGKQPIDGNYHRFTMFSRTDKTFWYIDNLDVPVAVSNFQFPNTQRLPLCMQVVAGTTGVTSTALTCTGAAVGDTGSSSISIGDGNNPFLKMAVSPYGAAATIEAPEFAALQGKMFNATTGDINLSSLNETPLVILVNPSSSGKTIKLSSVEYGVPNNNSAYYLFKVYLNPTVTANGAAINPVGSRQAYQNSSVANLYKSSTVSSNGTLMIQHRFNQQSGVSKIAKQFSIFVDPGNSFLITVTPTNTNLLSYINMQWKEE